MTREHKLALALLAVLICFGGCRSKSAGEQRSYQQEFATARECGSTKGAERRLVRAFVLAECDYVPYELRLKVCKSPLERLAMGADAFVVYRDFKKDAKPLIGYPDENPEEGFAVMDRYAQARPDFGKSEIRCEARPIDFKYYEYAGWEEASFPSLPDPKRNGTIRVIVNAMYLSLAPGRLEPRDRMFEIEAANNAAIVTTEVGYGNKNPLDGIPDFTRAGQDHGVKPN